jgi:Carboxypeptidase regulatory-like domain/TonB-dependent Receptor Plug Domain
MNSGNSVVKPTLLVFLLLVILTPVAAQTTSGSLSGIITDAHGAAVSGAKVKVTSASRGEVSTANTEDDGRFVFPQLDPDQYRLRVEVTGFKPFEKSIVLNANDKISAGTIALEVGAVSEMVTVTAGAVELQTESAERGAAIRGKQLDNIAINGRSYLALTGLATGIVNTNSYAVAGHAGLSNIFVNGARGNQNNLTLDGVGNVDTGNNGDQLATVSIDAVSEFKILTADYQAEYGRSSGAQISVVTRSGGREFHGSGYLFHRHEGLNANNWRNNRDGLVRNFFRFNNFGYTIGGPVYVPKVFNTKKEKLFFFWSQEYQRQLRPQGERRVRVPSALERQGDFSQTLDNSGNPFPFIRDYTTGLPCSSSDTRGCFKDGGVLGRIPKNRLFGPGLAILNLYPAPNAESLEHYKSGYNFTSQISDSYPRREDLVRIDWNPTNSWRVFGRYVNNFDAITSFYGSFVLGSNLPIVPITDARPGKALALSATKTINPTTINEIRGGYGWNQINIDPTTDALTRAKTGLTNLPMLFPDAIQKDFIPNFSYGSRAGTNPGLGTRNAPFFNFNRTIDIVDNFSKVFNKHSLKTGVYYQKSQKDQTSFASANGDINFGESSSNPFDSGFGYSNAALGIYSSFSQASKYATGKYRYTNLEFYGQDNWKVNRRLTLDYGMRFYYMPPQYDADLQTATFRPDLWDPSKASRLYRPTLVNGKRVGIDPATGKTTDSFNIGKIVPGSGDFLNGIFQAGKGVPKGLQETPHILLAPRFGFAYDLTGRQNIVLRGGVGVFYDRYQGNETFDMITNPPTTVAPTLQFDLLSNIDPKNILLAPPSLNAFSFEGKIPTVYNFNFGIQAKLPYQFMLDVSYVGSQSRHLLQRVNINAIPYGAAFRKENQDPTQFTGGVVPSVEPSLAAPYTQAGLSFSGGKSLSRDFLRPFQGFGDITMHQMGGTANYNSMQTSLERRFAKNLLFGVSHTWSRAMGTATADGSFFRIDQFNRLSNYGPLDFDRRHNLAVHWVYELPGITRLTGQNRVLGLVGDHWQISGLYAYQSGAPYGIGFSIPGIQNQNLTGSFTEGARIRIIGAGGVGYTSDPYRQIDTSAFTIPLPGSIGLESGRNYMRGPGVNNVNLSLQKSIPIGETRRLQVRVDAFNVFNHTQFSGVNTTLNVRSLTDPTPTNLPFDAAGNLVNRNGFGTVNGARDPRILQLVARFQF